MKLLIPIVLLLFTFQVQAQITVVGISGDAYGMINEDEENYKALTYGPLNDVKRIIVKENSQVSIINQNDALAKLNEGEYEVSSLSFNRAEEKSLFTKFCSYYKAFFMHHNSTESKKSYTNNIYAISRGTEQAPVLDFPLDGTIAKDMNQLFFLWTHDCEECEYILTISELSTKEVVFSKMTTDKRVIIEDFSKYLSDDKGYFWSVKIAGKDVKSDNRLLEIGNYSSKDFLYEYSNEFQQISEVQSDVARFVYITSRFDEAGMFNEAILCGLQMKKMGKLSEEEVTISENYMYDVISKFNNP